jgi:hypothetical protein
MVYLYFEDGRRTDGYIYARGRIIIYKIHYIAKDVFTLRRH